VHYCWLNAVGEQLVDEVVVVVDAVLVEPILKIARRNESRPRERKPVEISLLQNIKTLFFVILT
jgi:hypothetical protein